MTKIEYLEKARELLSDGRVFGAKRLLLEAGYGKAQEEQARAAYDEIFPLTKEIQEKLDGVLTELFSDDPEKRQAAAKQVSAAGLSEVGGSASSWLMDHRTMERLIQALDSKDEIVEESATMAVGRMVGPYFPDQRAREPLRRRLGSKRPLTRLWAIKGLWFLDRHEAWRDIAPLFADRDPRVRAEVLAMPMDEAVPPETRTAFRERVVAALDDADAQIRRTAGSLLRWVGDERSLPALAKAASREKDKSVRSALREYLGLLANTLGVKKPALTKEKSVPVKKSASKSRPAATTKAPAKKTATTRTSTTKASKP